MTTIKVNNSYVKVSVEVKEPAEAHECIKAFMAALNAIGYNQTEIKQAIKQLHEGR